MPSIKELQSGSYITDQPFAVTSLVQKTTKAGAPYLQLTLTDPSGQIDAKVWNDAMPNVDLKEGTVGIITGRVGEYQGKLDLTISKASTSSEDSFDQHLSAVPTMIFDIETVGERFEDLEDWDQDYFLHRIEGNTDEAEAKTKTGLYSLYGFVQAIGITSIGEGLPKGIVLSLTDKQLKPENNDFTYHTFKTEKDLIQKFWDLTGDYQRFVTYNGRGFDFPFLVIRSGINRVKIPMEIDDYNKTKFVDLADRLRQGGRQFKLEAFCRAFGITNPKQPGVSGLYVSQLYREGKHQEIADYVSRDALSTHELYAIWREYLSGHLNF
jgi:hypothetical protein